MVPFKASIGHVLLSIMFKILKKYSILIFTYILLSIMCVQHVTASRDSVPQFILDEETESLIDDWLNRFFKVANLSIPPKVYLIKTAEINAAATFGGIILVYTGLILKCKNASQLMGVLAHETGHIAGGHIARTMVTIDDAAKPALATLIIGGITSIAVANPLPLIASIAGSGNYFERSILKHSREQEDAADAAALNYLTALHLPASGLVEFWNILGQHYTTGREDPYLMTHPLSIDRKQKIQIFIDQQKKKFKVPDVDEERFKRVRAKMYGYLKSRMEVYAEYPLSDTSISARYARLIADYVSSTSTSKANDALKKLEELLVLVPNDPYFMEMQGQFLFETGRVEESIGYLRKSLSAKPHAHNIRLMLCHALVESVQTQTSESTERLKESITELTKIVKEQPENVMAWHLLGTAYGKNEQTYDAAACLAEEAIQTNQIQFAEMEAKRGQKALNPSLRQRASDILEQIKIMKNSH